MRGYLRHIAAKVIGGPAAVRPRVPSLFEPAKDFASSPFKQALRRERSAIDTSWGSVDQERDAMPEISPRMPVSQSTESSGIATTNVRQQNDRNSEASSATTRISTAPAPSHPKTFETREPVRQTPSIQPQQSIEMHVHAKPAKRVLQDTESGEMPLPSRARLRTTASHESAETRLSERKATGVEASKDRVETRREMQLPSISRTTNQAALDNAVTAILSGARATIAPQPVMNEGKASGNVPLAAAPTQPSVQVVIGRVIVEAITPPAAPAPLPMRGPTPPKLSLEDYLRERRA